MDNEEWTTCPYNRAHRVPRLRIQAHLVKCEAQYPPLAICPYNATHRMPQERLKAHIRECPSVPPAHLQRDERRAQPPPPRPPQDLLRGRPDPRDEDWDN